MELTVTRLQESGNCGGIKLNSLAGGIEKDPVCIESPDGGAHNLFEQTSSPTGGE